MENKNDIIKVPYCKIDGVKYQLYWVNGVLRFNDDGRPMPNLNQMAMDYFNGKSPLSERFDYSVNSGSSYEYVFGIFSKNGINNHMVTQGPEPSKKFYLYLGKSKPNY